jgi:hypothetical protein
MGLKEGGGGGGGCFLITILSYFALITLHKNFREPRAIPSWRKVCVGGGGGC